LRERVFLAGATGAIGSRLVPLLVGAGYAVFGATRSPEKARELERLGATPVVVDVFDRLGLAQALRGASPGVVIHQLTDLPKALSGPPSAEILKANARVREEGTRNLVAAAIAGGARRLIAQSIAWVYAPGPQPHVENDPLDRDGGGPTIAGVLALEHMTLGSPPLQGAVLRYGRLYGPGTWNTAQNGPVPVHVDAAAHAALLAIDAPAGVYNIAEEKGLVSSAKARRLLGWSAAFRLPNVE